MLKSVGKLGAHSGVSCCALKEKWCVLGDTNGGIVVYEIENGEFEEFKQRQNLVDSAITALEIAGDLLFVLSSEIVSVYELNSLKLIESLPIKPVSSTKINKKLDYVAISNSKMVVIYHLINNQLEMVKTLKLDEALLNFELLEDDRIIILSSNYSYVTDFKPESEIKSVKMTSKLAFYSSFFNRASNHLIPINSELVLINKNNNSLCNLLNLQNLGVSDVKLTTPFTQLGLLQPFLVLINNNELKLMNFQTKHIIQSVKLDSKIIDMKSNSSKVIVLTTNGVSLYDIADYNGLIAKLQNDNLVESISILNQLSNSSLKDKFLKLRELEIQLAINSLKDHTNLHSISSSMLKFSEFIASPFIVISFFPKSISGEYYNKSKCLLVQNEDGNDHHVDIDLKAIELLTHYLTDIRRKFNKLLNSPKQELPYYDSKLTTQMFTNNNQHSIEETRAIIDTTLFRCYSIINPVLIGSLVRLDNYCDSKIVIENLKSQHLNKELIDYYFKKRMHKEALDLLLEISQKTDNYDLLINYLQKLNNDNLDICLEYAKYPIEVNESYAIEIFIESINSAALDRHKILGFISKFSANLKRIYLEYLIFELNDNTKQFGNDLVQIYLSEYKSSELNLNSIYYKKLYNFLQNGSYDLRKNLSLFDGEQDESLILLKSFILKRLQEFNKVLKIYVFEIKNYQLAIDLIVGLFNKENKDSNEHLIQLINYFKDIKNKDLILSLLKNLNKIEKLNLTKISIIKILQNLPNGNQIKIFEIESLLIKQLNLIQNDLNLNNLNKNFKIIENIKVEEKLLNLQKENVKFESNKTKCLVCGNVLNANNILRKFPNGDLIHLGCFKNYQVNHESNYKKLKTIKLKDYYN